MCRLQVVPHSITAILLYHATIQREQGGGEWHQRVKEAQHNTKDSKTGGAIAHLLRPQHCATSPSSWGRLGFRHPAGRGQLGVVLIAERKKKTTILSENRLYTGLHCSSCSCCLEFASRRCCLGLEYVHGVHSRDHSTVRIHSTGCAQHKRRCAVAYFALRITPAATSRRCRSPIFLFGDCSVRSTQQEISAQKNMLRHAPEMF